MQYVRKTMAMSLVAILASFMGGLCMHVIPAQAMEVSAMESDFSNAFPSEDIPITAWNLCVIDCASTVSEMTLAKKVSVDFSLQSALTSDDEFIVSEFSSAPDFLNTHPPAPDILSSVFKKE